MSESKSKSKIDFKVAAITVTAVIPKREKKSKQPAYLTKGKLIALIAEEDTVVGFLLGGIGEMNENRKPNFLVVDEHTTVEEIGAQFEAFYKRGDIDIILISQIFADLIRPQIEAHTEVVPTVLEIPSMYCEFDPSKDSILRRAKGLFSADEFR